MNLRVPVDEFARSVDECARSGSLYNKESGKPLTRIIHVPSLARWRYFCTYHLLMEGPLFTKGRENMEKSHFHQGQKTWQGKKNCFSWTVLWIDPRLSDSAIQHVQFTKRRKIKSHYIHPYMPE